jgi:hypothetical protein
VKVSLIYPIIILKAAQSLEEQSEPNVNETSEERKQENPADKLTI